MKYVEAFKSLGYDVPNPRQDWSAEKHNGVCITLWRSQVQWTPASPQFDLWSLWEPGTHDFERLPGQAKRTEHLMHTMSKFGGSVDVIIVKGTPGKSYQDAEPWVLDQRKNYGWRITKFDASTGFFSAAAEKQE